MPDLSCLVVGDHSLRVLRRAQVSVEAALRIVYQPQAIFRVRPVSRCTASLAGAALPAPLLATCGCAPVPTSALADNAASHICQVSKSQASSACTAICMHVSSTWGRAVRARCACSL